MGTDDLFKRRKAKKESLIHRRKAQIESYDRVLIVCEGTKTEPIYLESMRSYFDLSQTNIVIDPNSDSSPGSVVKYALEKIRRERDNPYNRVFCVIDRDTHNDFYDALQKIDSFRSSITRLEAIVSDPCFEYWLLLHFEYTTMPFGTGEKSPCKDLVSKRLNIYLPDYGKSDYNTIASLVNSEQLYRAIAYAKRTMQSAQREDRKSSFTQMHILAEYLKNLKRIKER